ncbi:Uncharacterised protein [Klebsiella pneumoniae]|uniref:Uncharacterized protein n=1 Tax=Klebsiella pneumoniae TaxID=573 RepID=A0A377TMQ3_KLEPN|nr:Uncharacterised protein [Klebsiella pneumoniae]
MPEIWKLDRSQEDYAPGLAKVRDWVSKEPLIAQLRSETSGRILTIVSWKADFTTAQPSTLLSNRQNVCKLRKDVQKRAA